VEDISSFLDLTRFVDYPWQTTGMRIRGKFFPKISNNGSDSCDGSQRKNTKAAEIAAFQSMARRGETG
jgi:hypothetical protein